MAYASGTAKIRHAETGNIYEVGSELIDFQEVGSDERSMGPETVHSAIVNHPELGQLVWSLWEYPQGAENDRETDVGPHELISNIDFGLESEPLDEESDEPDLEDADLKSRVEFLVEWFLARYEDPAQRLPYVSREGGYQWIYGGPYDAREVLNENFPDESEQIVEAAVDEIESDGLTDWAPVPSADDYDEEPLADEPHSNVGEVISGIPDPAMYPIFKFGDDGRIYTESAPDQEIALHNSLLDELRVATDDLRKSLAGTNAHVDLLKAVERYEVAVDEESISISRLYARGVRLDNAAFVAQHDIESGNLPTLTSEAKQHLMSCLELHRSYIMAHDKGRTLAQGAASYQKSPDETAKLQQTAKKFAEAVNQAPTLFAEEVREQITVVMEDVGRGPQPERSNQVGLSFFVNLITVLLKGTRKAGGYAAAAVVGTAIIASVPGGAIVSGTTAEINAAWSFLTANASVLIAMASFAGSETTWLPSLSYILDRLRSYLAK